MNRLLMLTLLLGTSFVLGEEEQLPPWHWSNWDLSTFSRSPPDTLGIRFANIREQRPPAEVMDEVRDRLARNEEYRKWISGYLAERPVTWENIGQREAALWVVENLRAEWAVRFLLDLRADDRPMTSSKYDYTDPEFLADFEKLSRESPSAAIAFAEDSGLGRSGRNSDLANGSVMAMGLAGAPSSLKQYETGVSALDWLVQQERRGRIPEIVKATWGDKAVLNVELGLGPDNRPLAEGAPEAPAPETGRPPISERSGKPPGVADPSASRRVPWLPLGGALLVLAFAGGLLWSRRKSTEPRTD